MMHTDVGAETMEKNITDLLDALTRSVSSCRNREWGLTMVQYSHASRKSAHYRAARTATSTSGADVEISHRSLRILTR
jgi:hypothetical protein